MCWKSITGRMIRPVLWSAWMRPQSSLLSRRASRSRPSLADPHAMIMSMSATTLRGQDAEFGFCHIEPTAVFGRVVPLEPLDEAACLCGGKSLVERSRFVSAEIILHEDDFRGAGKWMSDNSLRTGA